MADAPLRAAAESAPANPRYGCPTAGAPRGAPQTATSPEVTDVPYAVGSGCFIPMEVLRVAGGMREDLFIGAVDFEHCFWLRRPGYLPLRVRDATLTHHLGGLERRELRPVRVSITVHLPLRLQCALRDHVLLTREHASSALGRLLRGMAHLATLLGQIVFLENRNRPQLLHCGSEPRGRPAAMLTAVAESPYGSCSTNAQSPEYPQSPAGPHHACKSAGPSATTA